MAQIVLSGSKLIDRYARPVLTSSSIFGCTMFVGDILGQCISSQTTTIDFKRSLCVGISGFLFSGPVSMSVNNIVRKLYPGFGRYTVMKRIAISTCLSPLTIACGIVPSVYLQTRDPEMVRERLVNRLPLSWAMSMLLISPFSYIHTRYIVRRLQNVTRNTYNVAYNSVVSSKQNCHVEEDFLVNMFM